MGRKGDFRGLEVVKGVFECVPSDITWGTGDKSKELHGTRRLGCRDWGDCGDSKF